MSFRLRLKISFAILSLLSLMIGVVGASLLSVSLTRSATQQEERAEDLTLAVRVDVERRSTAKVRGVTNETVSPTQLRVGRVYRPSLFPPRGHRLPNGLLAPLTC